jgi:hypothetical protein
MDPNEALETMRKCAASITRMVDRGAEPDADDATELAESLKALDEWLSRGGFLPAAWERH